MDKNQERVKAFVRRLYRLWEVGWGGTEFVAGGLYLLGEVSATEVPLALC